ncbi:MAG: hypothetical protein KGI88_08340, partial [Betaproteobacteria bacterium]|nr:hypothetical protein [Betaproteobacteria bacterium]
MTKTTLKSKKNTNLRQILTAELKLTTPKLGKDYLYDRCVDKYLITILPAISKAIAFSQKSYNYRAMEFPLQQTILRNSMGRIGTKQLYIADVMKKHATTSLIVEIKKGYAYANSSMPSLVKLNPKYERLIFKELINQTVVKNSQQADEADLEPNLNVDVDPQSLASFINKTTTTINQTKANNAYKRQLIRNLLIAKELQARIVVDDEKYPLPHLKETWSQADSGRIYGHGLSLQRIPKEVR